MGKMKRDVPAKHGKVRLAHSEGKGISAISIVVAPIHVQIVALNLVFSASQKATKMMIMI